MSTTSDSRGASNACPWLGLASYGESDSEFFFARDEECKSLLEMAETASVAVLHGPSGTGKTSLLQAGLLPLLRRRQQLPIVFRTGALLQDGNFLERLKQELAKEANRHEIEINLPQDYRQDLDSLWMYFHCVELWNKHHQLLVPVLILDQFEEVYTTAGGSAVASSFLDELADLVENRVPRNILVALENPGSLLDIDHRCQHYHVLLSLRDEYVGRLDELAPAIPSLRHNRMYLRAFNAEKARRAILGPGEEIVSAEVADAIVRFVAGTRTADGVAEPAAVPDHLEVQPTLLNIVCHELNAHRIEQGMTSITDSLLEREKSDILECFYDQSMTGIGIRAIHFVEDKLVTGMGHRASIPCADAERMGMSPSALGELVDRRLLIVEERFRTPHVELSHDVLTSVVRNKRAKRKRREVRNRWILCGAVLLGMLCTSASMVYSKQKNDAIWLQKEVESKQQQVEELQKKLRSFEISLQRARESRDEGLQAVDEKEENRLWEVARTAYTGIVEDPNDNPYYLTALHELAWMLATWPKMDKLYPEKALELAQLACSKAPNLFECRRSQAAAMAASGDFQGAAAEIERLLTLREVERARDAVSIKESGTGKQIKGALFPGRRSGSKPLIDILQAIPEIVKNAPASSPVADKFESEQPPDWRILENQLVAYREGRLYVEGRSEDEVEIALLERRLGLNLLSEKATKVWSGLHGDSPDNVRRIRNVLRKCYESGFSGEDLEIALESNSEVSLEGLHKEVRAHRLVAQYRDLLPGDAEWWDQLERDNSTRIGAVLAFCEDLEQPYRDLDAFGRLTRQTTDNDISRLLRAVQAHESLPGLMAEQSHLQNCRLLLDGSEPEVDLAILRTDSEISRNMREAILLVDEAADLWYNLPEDLLQFLHELACGNHNQEVFRDVFTEMLATIILVHDAELPDEGLLDTVQDLWDEASSSISLSQASSEEISWLENLTEKFEGLASIAEDKEDRKVRIAALVMKLQVNEFLTALKTGDSEIHLEVANTLLDLAISQSDDDYEVELQYLRRVDRTTQSLLEREPNNEKGKFFAYAANLIMGFTSLDSANDPEQAEYYFRKSLHMVDSSMDRFLASVDLEYSRPLGEMSLSLTLLFSRSSDSPLIWSYRAAKDSYDLATAGDDDYDMWDMMITAWNIHAYILHWEQQPIAALAMCGLVDWQTKIMMDKFPDSQDAGEDFLVDLEALRGNIYMALGNSGKALEHFKRVKHDEGDVQLASWLARARMGQRSLANRSLKTYLQEQKKTSGEDGIVEIAQFLLGDLSEAKLLARIAGDEDPMSFSAQIKGLYYAGAVRLLKGDTKGAQGLFQKAVGIDLDVDALDHFEYQLARYELKRMGID